MTTGSTLYLVMSIGMFVVFSLVLAYQSWQQSRLGPETLPAVKQNAAPAHEEPKSALAA